jgi:hypothetical protein
MMEELRRQYLHASKKEKSRILDEFVNLTDLNCFSARRILRARTKREKCPVHRPPTSVTKGGPPYAALLLRTYAKRVEEMKRFSA